MPSAKQIFMQTGFAGLAIASSPFKRVEMAQDAMPRAALPGAAGGRAAARDQDDPDDDNNDDNEDGGGIYETPATATFAKLHRLLAANLGPDDLDAATQLIQQLFSDTADGNGGGGAMAADSSSYAKRFPHSGRLGREGLTGIVPGSGNSSSMAADQAASSGDYLRRFPHANRLGRTIF